MVLALVAMHKEGKLLGFQVSWAKIKVQVFGSLLDDTLQSLHVNDKEIEISDDFTYLGGEV